MNYLDFLKSKIQLAPESGFTAAEPELSPALKPHQKASVLWAQKGLWHSWNRLLRCRRT